MPNKDIVRVAMIGAGGMSGAVHYPSLASFSDVEMVAVCDIDTERLHKRADKYGIEKRYTDYQKMVEDVAPDAVYVIGQPHIMYDIWEWCLAEGLNVCIEKPLGLTRHQAEKLADLATAHGCITQVSFQRRSHPMVRFLRDECLKRGPITHAYCRFYKSDIHPMRGARDHMMDDTVHSIDTVRWMCGGEVAGVHSHTRRVGVPDINFISAELHFDNGAVGFLINSWSSGRRIFAVEMHAPNICVEAEHERMGVLYADGDTDGVKYDAHTFTGSDELYVYGGFQAKNREFIDALKSGTPPQSNFVDAAKTMAVAETILAQALLAGR